MSANSMEKVNGWDGFSLQELEERVEFMAAYVTDSRRARIQTVLDNRTRQLSVVLENIYQPHNASACLRTCDCFGVQDVNIIESQKKYRVNPDITLGADKWLTIRRYGTEDATNHCIEDLKRRGYKIAATALSNDSVNLENIEPDAPIALVFGTEKEGLSSFWLENADMIVKLPMWGFTQSFNVSVSLAVSLAMLTPGMRKKESWPLTEKEKMALKLEWYMNSTNRGIQILQTKFS